MGPTKGEGTMDHFRIDPPRWPAFGALWNAAVAVALLVGLWLPAILGHG